MKLLPRLLFLSAVLSSPVLLAQSYSEPATAGEMPAAPKGPREIGFAFMQTAKINPKAYKGMKTGPFKLPFVAEPKLVKDFNVRAEIPAELTKMQQEGYVLAALKVSPEGKVVHIGLLDSSPKGIVEKSAQEFFAQVAYEPQKRRGQAIEFETNVFLAFKFVAEAPQKGPPGRQR